MSRIITTLLMALFVAVVMMAPSARASGFVNVCDPVTLPNCLKPNGDGSLPATSNVTSPAPTITITAGAYSANNVIGGIVSFTAQPTTGVLANASCTFDSGSFSAGTIDFNVFSASPTGGGTTDHAAFALTATDTAKLVGIIHLNDCSSLGGALAECQALYQNQFYTLAASGTTIFIVPVVRTGAPTFAGTGDMKCNIQVVK